MLETGTIGSHWEVQEGRASILFLIFALLCVAWSIQAAEWVEGLAILQGVVLGSAILGIILAKSRFPNHIAHLLSFLAGLAWSAFLVSRVLVDQGQLPGKVAVVELEALIRHFLFVALPRGISAHNLVFLLILALSLWWMGYFCAWAAFRWQRVWWAISVSGLALLLNINAAKINLTGYLIGFLVFALLLVVRISLASYEQEWRHTGVQYSPDLVYSFLRAGFLLSTLAILLAWLVPGVLTGRPLQKAMDRIGEPWRKLQDRSSQIFSDLHYPGEPPLLYTDRRTWFGGPIQLTDAPVAEVRAATGRYWRVMVFHEYTGDGWVNTDTDTILIGANEQDLAFPEWALRREISQTVILQRDWGSFDAIIAAGQPLRASVPMQAVVSYISYEEDIARARGEREPVFLPGDPSALYAQQLLRAGSSYQVLSSLSTADEESLRRVSADYPPWIKPRYLQLPESLPLRVRQLAGEITANQQNPYDKAKAIEAYLREIPYNEKIKGPSPGQDGVDYFLFDAQQGYCDYYASAMVVLLRAAGVPARYVRGYSQSTKEQGVYRILEKDGHAWPEVFFPGYGWIEFEPTGGEPPLNRPASRQQAESPPNPRLPGPWPQNLDDLRELGPDEDLGPPIEPMLRFQLWMRRWAGLALGVALIGLAAVALSVARRRRFEGLSLAERAYEELVDWASRLLGMAPHAYQTPHEYAALVACSVPRGGQAIERIATLYVEERFGHKAVPPLELEPLQQEARSAIWRCWLDRRTDRIRRFRWALVPPAAQVPLADEEG